MPVPSPKKIMSMQPRSAISASSLYMARSGKVRPVHEPGKRQRPSMWKKDRSSARLICLVTSTPGRWGRKPGMRRRWSARHRHRGRAAEQWHDLGAEALHALHEVVEGEHDAAGALDRGELVDLAGHRFGG